MWRNGGGIKRRCIGSFTGLEGEGVLQRGVWGAAESDDKKPKIQRTDVSADRKRKCAITGLNSWS
jgi:hypothetical protein